jgi:PAS domain S-box-containing protein
MHLGPGATCAGALDPCRSGELENHARIGYSFPVLKDFDLPAETLLDLIVDTVVVVDAHGRFLYTSASCEALFGYTADELRGAYMIELVHPEDRGRTLQASWQVMSGQPVVGYRNRYIRKDGSIVTVEWSSQWSEQHDIRVAVARRAAEE